MANHSTSRCQQIAESNTILRCVVGSGLYGTGIADVADRDEMGICIEPPSCVIGLEPFEQYEFHTAGKSARSYAGDLDLTIYSLRKWAKLAAGGNPNVLQILFAREPNRLVVDELNIGGLLQEKYAGLFVTRQAARQFSGYLISQASKMKGDRGNMTNRPELVDEYGFDTKFAYHAVRLGLQGVELLETGNITLPVPEPDRTWLTDLRVGRHTMAEALERIDILKHELEVLSTTANLPEKPDMANINAFLSRCYRQWWDFFGLAT